MDDRILVIGGSGMLGRPVVNALQAHGVRVRVMTRLPETMRGRFGDDVELIQGDVTVPDSLEEALRGCQGVHINLRSNSDLELERQGVRIVVNAAAKVGVTRITYLSAASVCAENCWFAGTRAKFEAEAAIRESGIPYSIFRATWFMEGLAAFIREIGGRKRTLEIGRHPYPYHWIAAEDYARMVANAYGCPEAANKTFVIYGPAAYTMRQALAIYRRIAHPDASPMFLSLSAAAIIARLGHREELLAAIPLFRYMQRVREHDDADEANRLLGEPRTTLEQWSRIRASRMMPEVELPDSQTHHEASLHR